MTTDRGFIGHSIVAPGNEESRSTDRGDQRDSSRANKPATPRLSLTVIPLLASRWADRREKPCPGPACFHPPIGELVAGRFSEPCLEGRLGSMVGPAFAAFQKPFDGARIDLFRQ